MKYSDWQLNRLRDSLRAYHCYGRSHDGEYFTWKDVSEAIAEYTDIYVPDERLRQFVEGVNNKEGGRKFPVPKDSSLEGITRFVTDEELHLISEEELNEFNLSKQAPLRLLEYLDQKFDQERIVPFEKIQGRYFIREQNEQEYILRELTLQRPSKDGLMQVVETKEYFKLQGLDEIEKQTQSERQKKCLSRQTHAGWAILTPEDNLLFFLKEGGFGKNLYYLTIALDLIHWSDVPITRLVILHHDFPIELESHDDKRKITQNFSEEVSKKVFVFERVEGLGH